MSTDANLDDAAPDDDRLMLAYAQRGELAAFDLLYARYRGPLYRYLLGQVPKAQADEIFQETWASLIDHRHQYRADGRFRFWLFRIAHRKLVDQVRQRRWLPFGPAEAEAVDDGDGQDPQSQLEQAQRQELLLASLQTLPFAQREVVLLRQQGFAPAEIAEITQTDFEAVKSRLRYAFKKLRTTWEALYG